MTKFDIRVIDDEWLQETASKSSVDILMIQKKRCASRYAPCSKSPPQHGFLPGTYVDKFHSGMQFMQTSSFLHPQEKKRAKNLKCQPPRWNLESRGLCSSPSPATQPSSSTHITRHRATRPCGGAAPVDLLGAARNTHTRVHLACMPATSASLRSARHHFVLVVPPTRSFFIVPVRWLGSR
jgi:hypothetical protein